MNTLHRLATQSLSGRGADPPSRRVGGEWLPRRVDAHAGTLGQLAQLIDRQQGRVVLWVSLGRQPEALHGVGEDHRRAVRVAEYRPGE